MSSDLLDNNAFDTTAKASAFLAEVLDASTEYAILATANDGSIVLWNEGARRLYGYECSEIFGRPLSAVHATAPEHPAPWAGTVECVRKGNTRFTAHVVQTRLCGADGEPDGHLLVSSDITDQLRLNLNLDRAEAYATSLLDSAPDAMVIVNREGMIQLTNAEATKMFGYERSQLVGQPVEVLIPERYRERHGDHRAGFFATPRARPMGAGFELWGLRADGSEVSVEISLSPLETDEGMLVTAAIRDATERKRAEGKFRGLLESAPDAMVIVGDSGDIQLANAETSRLFGYGREELIGRKVEMLIPARYHDRHPGHRSRFFAEPRARPMGAGLDLWGRRQDGTEFPVEISLSPLETEDGLLATAAIRDVTERRRVEQELRDTNARLQTADQAKDRFLASMSHELRTPLNAIVGFTGTLLMGMPGPLTDEQEKQLLTVQRNGKHLLSLINDLLDLGRIQSGKVELLIEPIMAKELLEEVALGLRPLADQKGLDLRVEAPDDLELSTDRRALSQILINLVNNAIKFTDEGAVRLELSRHNGPAPHLTRFAVVDTGRGLSREDQKRLFAPFEQIEAPAGAGMEGTGLGLYICRALADQLGASIGVQSELGSGSTFTLDLPD